MVNNRLTAANSRTETSAPSQPPCGAQQQLPVFRIAFPVKAQKCEFVSLANLPSGVFVGAEHQEFDIGVQYLGDTGQVAGDLAGAPGFPLGNGAARDADLISQLVLGKAPISPRGTDAIADVRKRLHVC